MYTQTRQFITKLSNTHKDTHFASTKTINHSLTYTNTYTYTYTNTHTHTHTHTNKYSHIRAHRDTQDAIETSASESENVVSSRYALTDYGNMSFCFSLQILPLQT